MPTINPLYAFAFNKTNTACFLYPQPDLKPNPNFDSGVRQSAALSQSTQTVTAPSFESRPNVVARDAATVVERGMTMATCQDKCGQLSSCAAFTFNKNSKACYLYNAVSRFEPMGGPSGKLPRNRGD